MPVVSDEVMILCRLIHPSNLPRYVEVRPWPHARRLECFVNVREKVSLEGGKIQYGWALWQPTGAFLAAEHHAVYEPQSGPPWIDITPHNSIAVNILFLPDEKAIYTSMRRDNVRLPLVDDVRVLEFDRLKGEYKDILNLVRGAVPAQLEPRVREIEQRLNLLWTELIEAYPLPSLGRHDPCFCCSGKKYEECHGRNVPHEPSTREE